MERRAIEIDECVDCVCLPRADLPPYSPELNPAERVFEEVRRWIEGKVYQRMEDKVAAVAAYLTYLESDPARVRALCGWDWIEEAIEGLPAHLAARSDRIGIRTYPATQIYLGVYLRFGIYFLPFFEEEGHVIGWSWGCGR